MGRELKRVPLDFKWPTNQVWGGYINPYNSMECQSCKGSGLNPATKKLDDDWYTHLRTDGLKGWSKDLIGIEVEALAKDGRLDSLIPKNPHFDEEKNKWFAWINREKVEVEAPEYPSAEIVNDYFSKSVFGHDSINRYICVRARAKHLGIYGKCEYCNGEGVIWASEDIKKLYEEWQSFEPPVGVGFQLWETTSEGSPQSPVFETLEQLGEWCADNATTFASFKATKENWVKMLGEELVIEKQENVIFIE